MRRNLLWCILGTQSRERRLRLGRSVQLPPCPLIPTPSQGPRRHQPHWRSGQYHKAAAGDFPLHHPKHPSLPRRLAPVGIYTCDHISICPSADGGAGTPGTHSTGPDRLRPPQSRGHIIRGWRTGQDTPGPSRAPEPVRPSTIQGSNPLVHPRDGGPERSARALMLPRYRPDHAQSPHLTRHTSGGRPAKEPGHSSCPGIGLPRPAHHPSFSGRRAGE